MEGEMLGFVCSRRTFGKGAQVKFDHFGITLKGLVLEQSEEGRVRIALTKPVIVVTKTIRKNGLGVSKR